MRTLGDVKGMLRDDAHHHEKKVETAAATPEDRNDYFSKFFSMPTTGGRSRNKSTFLILVST